MYDEESLTFWLFPLSRYLRSLSGDILNTFGFYDSHTVSKMLLDILFELFTIPLFVVNDSSFDFYKRDGYFFNIDLYKWFLSDDFVKLCFSLFSFLKVCYVNDDNIVPKTLYKVFFCKDTVFDYLILYMFVNNLDFKVQHDVFEANLDYEIGSFDYFIVEYAFRADARLLVRHPSHIVPVLKQEKSDLSLYNLIYDDIFTQFDANT